METKDNNPNKITEHPAEVTITDSPNQFVGYANINGVTLTAEEAIIHFGTRRQESPELADGIAKIYVGLPHIKRIAIMLAQIIGSYEEAFGEIPTDPSARISPEARKRLEGHLKASKLNENQDNE